MTLTHNQEGYVQDSWHSYPKSYNLGHRAVRDLLNYPHIIEEKIDGSQFSFGAFPVTEDLGLPVPVSWNYELRVRSKGCIMHTDAPEKMFTRAVASVKIRQHLLHPGWTYRGEYLRVPKHNALAYDRVPTGHIIIFDISTGTEEWLTYEEKKAEAERIGLECVPRLHQWHDDGTIETSYDRLRELLDNTKSVLGGQLIEGVVIKPTVPLFGVDGKTLLGKFVSERFKEVHKSSWAADNPTSGDVIQNLVKTYRAEGRWLKAIQHLRDAGQLEDSPRDIGKLLAEIKKDTGIEEKEAIKAALWKWAWPHIQRGIIGGFPEFYKEQLLKLQFGEDDGQV